MGRAPAAPRPLPGGVTWTGQSGPLPCLAVCKNKSDREATDTWGKVGSFWAFILGGGFFHFREWGRFILGTCPE